MAKKIKSFEDLDKQIQEKKYRDKLKDKYDDFVYWQSLDKKGKQKYLKDCGINFLETKGLYEPDSQKIIMDDKNPFTGEYIIFNARGMYDSKSMIMVKGHITINYEANNPEKVFGFIPVHHKVRFEQRVTGVPTQSRAAYEKEKQKAINENKAKAEEKRRIEANKEKELLARIESLEEYERIYFDDFVTVNNVNYCLNNNHDVEQVQALIFILRSSGKIMPKFISAGYCHDCKRHFIEKWQFENLSDYGIPLCQVIRENHDYYSNSEYNYFDELAPESILHRSGYNVSAEEGLTSTQRQKILALLLESGICSRHKITSHLSWLIDSRCGNPYLENAISKWTEDRKFASNYNIGDEKIVGVKLIRNVNRRNLYKY